MTLYEQWLVFEEEWQNEYGPRPTEFVPDINSEEFKEYVTDMDFE